MKKKTLLMAIVLIASIALNVSSDTLTNTVIGGKTITELCNTIAITTTKYTDYYKECITVCDSKNVTCVPAKYQCLDRIEPIETINYVCEANGKVKVNDKIIEMEDGWCELTDDKVCCYDNTDGGKYSAKNRDDNTINKYCYDIIKDTSETFGTSKFRNIEVKSRI